MPHQCIVCGTIYDDNAKEILTGCKKCGSRLFLYIRKERLEELKNIQNKLSEEERKEIEKDILDLIGDELEENKPVVLDLESIQIYKPGKYRIDLTHLFKGDPVIYKIEEGKYYIDIVSTLRNFLKKKS